MPDGGAHQPLNLSLNRFKIEERAYAYGYAEMDDIPLEICNGTPVIKDFEYDLYVSIGNVTKCIS